MPTFGHSVRLPNIRGRTGPCAEDTRCFYVAAAPYARDICARWATLARDKVIIDIFDDLTGNRTDLDRTEDAIRRIKSLLGNPE